jgi:hypothetical protein
MVLPILQSQVLSNCFIDPGLLHHISGDEVPVNVAFEQTAAAEMTA